MIQFFAVYQVLQWVRKENREVVAKPADLCSTTTTGALVFSEDQDSSMSIALKDLGDNVLFVSPKAVNIGHGSEPRNTLVIFKIPNEWRQ